MLGDPLQAIFGSKAEPLVDWTADVAQTFGQLENEHFDQRGWRWERTNPELGAWLNEVVRPALIDGRPISLANVPAVRWQQASPEASRAVHFPFVAGNDSTVFVLPAKHLVRPFASGRKGRFPALENRQLSSAMDAARRLDAATTGPEAAVALFNLVTSTTTSVVPLFGSGSRDQMLNRLARGASFAMGVSDQRRLSARGAFNELMASPRPATVAEAVRSIRTAGGDVHVYAPDCLRDVETAASALAAGRHDSYVEAVTALRHARRFTSPAQRSQCSSHTMLIKGLEFDHCIVVDAHQLPTAEHLYVALTRGARSLTVLSKDPTLNDH